MSFSCCGVLGESLLTRGIGRLKWTDRKSVMAGVVGFLRTWYRVCWRIWRLEQEPPPRGCILGGCCFARHLDIEKVQVGMREKSTYLSAREKRWAMTCQAPAIEKQRDWTLLFVSAFCHVVRKRGRLSVVVVRRHQMVAVQAKPGWGQPTASHHLMQGTNQPTTPRSDELTPSEDLLDSHFHSLSFSPLVHNLALSRGPHQRSTHNPQTPPRPVTQPTPKGK